MGPGLDYVLVTDAKMGTRAEPLKSFKIPLFFLLSLLNYADDLRTLVPTGGL